MPDCSAISRHAPPSGGPYRERAIVQRLGDAADREINLHAVEHERERAVQPHGLIAARDCV